MEIIIARVSPSWTRDWQLISLRVDYTYNRSDGTQGSSYLYLKDFTSFENDPDKVLNYYQPGRHYKRYDVLVAA